MNTFTNLQQESSLYNPAAMYLANRGRFSNLNAMITKRGEMEQWQNKNLPNYYGSKRIHS